MATARAGQGGDELVVEVARQLGAPVRIDPSVDVLEVQHANDVVPKLDLGDLRTNGIFGAPQESSHHTTESGFLTEGAGRATTVKVTVGRED